MKMTLIKNSILWMFGLAVVWAGAINALRAETATLPPEVREQLEKQRTAFKSFYVEYQQTLIFHGREITSTNTAYFKGNRFVVNEDEDLSFDGDVMWSASKYPSSDAHLILRKTSLKNTAKLTDLYWQLPYFDAAGIYCPKYPTDLGNASSLEPAVLHFLKNSFSTQIAQEGPNLRVTFYVDDWVLVNIRKTDTATFRKELERTAVGPEIIAGQLELLKKTKERTPKRKIVMLLDSKHGFAPSEREDWTADGHLIARYKVEDWKLCQEASQWLPAKCTVSYFTNPYAFDKFEDEPVKKLVLSLKTAEFAEREAEFTLIKLAKFKTGGTWILDDSITTTAHGVKTPVILTMAADGKLLRLGASGIRGEIPSASRRLWIFALLLVIAMPPVLFFISKSKKA